MTTAVVPSALTATKTGRRPVERSLPVITACANNFTADGPAAAAADCILDQETLSAMVLAVDRDAGHDGSRFDLAELLAGC